MFGSQSKLATLLGISQTTVSYWAKTGSIPAKWHGTVLALAHQHGIFLTPADFIFTSAPRTEKTKEISVVVLPVSMNPRTNEGQIADAVGFQLALLRNLEALIRKAG